MRGAGGHAARLAALAAQRKHLPRHAHGVSIAAVEIAPQDVGCARVFRLSTAWTGARWPLIKCAIAAYTVR
jgi:hypothetical protein